MTIPKIFKIKITDRNDHTHKTFLGEKTSEWQIQNKQIMNTGKIIWTKKLANNITAEELTFHPYKNNAEKLIRKKLKTQKKTPPQIAHPPKRKE